MNARELVLLSPYRLPAQHPLTLANDDMAAWLNGYSALWHPAALWGASGPPAVEATYDHEQPQPNRVYAAPDHPPLLLPDDWHARVKAAELNMILVTNYAMPGGSKQLASFMSATAWWTTPCRGPRCTISSRWGATWSGSTR